MICWWLAGSPGLARYASLNDANVVHASPNTSANSAVVNPISIVSLGVSPEFDQRSLEFSRAPLREHRLDRLVVGLDRDAMRSLVNPAPHSLGWRALGRQANAPGKHWVSHRFS